MEEVIKDQRLLGLLRWTVGGGVVGDGLIFTSFSFKVKRPSSLIKYKSPPVSVTC